MSAPGRPKRESLTQSGKGDLNSAPNGPKGTRLLHRDWVAL